MPRNLMKFGAEWLAGKLQQHAGDVVTYWRGSSSFSATATRALVEHDVVNSNESASTKFRFHDFQFTAADLRIDYGNGQLEPIEPRVNDRIEADGVMYDVVAIDDTKPCWEPLDSHGVMVVIHTRKA